MFKAEKLMFKVFKLTGLYITGCIFCQSGFLSQLPKPPLETFRGVLGGSTLLP